MLAKSMAFKSNRALLMTANRFQPSLLCTQAMQLSTKVEGKVDDDVQSEKRLKFSAFARRERDYNIEDQIPKKMTGLAEPF